MQLPNHYFAKKIPTPIPTGEHIKPNNNERFIIFLPTYRLNKRGLSLYQNKGNLLLHGRLYLQGVKINANKVQVPFTSKYTHHPTNKKPHECGT